jgi:hypothetical protein
MGSTIPIHVEEEEEGGVCLKIDTEEWTAWQTFFYTWRIPFCVVVLLS